ncbi:uncharacterized protein L201_002610 [Kwoniella dendrophila CBS 6074]|uniref:Uncharacterized protein n=1 Tax=Kwoniella dendrophila CBS 6074 TaxID=1295534 RepID=A0AAX4JTB5_9TREE
MVYPKNTHPLGHLINFIVIFENAHPNWKSGNELWLHTHSKEIIIDFNTGRKNFDPPLAIFNEKAKKGEFEFIGFWSIKSIKIVLPHSQESTSMLKVKESIRAFGHSGKINKSLPDPISYTWLKYNLEPIENVNYQLTKDMSRGEAARYTLSIGNLTKELDILISLDRLK